jgi:dTDP-glucose 4,6-dehydratase
MRMKILVTGGCGVVGTALIESLGSRGHQVLSCDLAHNHNEPASYVRCDIGAYRQIQQVIADFQPDVVYNCAAEFGRWNGEDFYEQLWRTNAIGTKNIIRQQEKHGFKLVHFSSSEVYGDWPECMIESVMDEYAVKQMNDYAMSKWVNEMQIRNSATKHGTESVVVRLFNTYGPGEYYSPYRSVNCRFLYSAIHSQPWTVFRGHRRTSTYLEDAVRTLANITDAFKVGETYNIGGAQLHTIEELSDIVIRQTGACQELVTFRDSEQLTTKIKDVDISKAERDLGHENTCGLEEGIARTSAWMMEVYN